MGAKILSKEEIIEKVKSGDIKISYYCTKPGSSFGCHNVDHRNMSNGAWKLFMDSLEPDCLRLNVGPYALVEHRSFLRQLWETRYGRKFICRNNQDIFDIRSGPLAFYPGENIVVGTNENITVGNRIGASLHAAVRNTDVGLPHIGTTIDPGWTGRLQIGLVNPTRTKKELNFMEQICKVRFHEHDKECSVLSKKEHSLSWEEIEGDTSNPYFPRRKGSFSRLEIEKSFRNDIIKYISNIVAIPSILYLFFNLIVEHNSTIDGHKERLNMLEQRLDIKKVESQVEINRDAISRLSPVVETQSKQKHISFTKVIGPKEKHFPISFGKEYKSEPSVFLLAEDDNVEYNIKVLPIQKGTNIIYHSGLVSAKFKKNAAIKEQEMKFDLYLVE